MNVIKKKSDLLRTIEKGKEIVGNNIFLWGTGNTAMLYQEGINRIKEEGFCIKGYVDNDCNKWGKELFGKKIYSPSQLQEFNDILVLIVSPQPNVVKKVGKQLDDMQINWMHIDEYIFKMHKKQILDVFDILEDNYSKKLFVHLIKKRMKGEYPSSKYCDKSSCFTFPSFMGEGIREVIIDCGAYVGDSIEKFILSRSGCFGKAYAIELNPNNVSAMKKRFERLKQEWQIADEQLVILPYAVSDVSSTSYIDNNVKSNGLSAKISSEGSLVKKTHEVKVISIDDYFCEKFDLLKADIESFEYKMIIGAKESIREYAPCLAISIYHNAVDFYSIPLLLKELIPEYKLSIRHFSYKMDDTILFASL